MTDRLLEWVSAAKGEPTRKRRRPVKAITDAVTSRQSLEEAVRTLSREDAVLREEREILKSGGELNRSLGAHLLLPERGWQWVERLPFRSSRPMSCSIGQHASERARIL